MYSLGGAIGVGSMGLHGLDQMSGKEGDFRAFFGDIGQRALLGDQSPFGLQ